jgi:ribose 5-phosphate isomerase B
MSKIIIGSDHGGFLLKSKIVELLTANGLEVNDVGTFDDKSVDYPDYAAKVASAVSKGEYPRGILICGSGIGVSIVANKFKGVRAALCTTVQLAKLSREHNDSNILCLGERVLKEKNALMMVNKWLSTPFEGGRHQTRVNKIHSVSNC